MMPGKEDSPKRNPKEPKEVPKEPNESLSILRNVSEL